MAVRRATIAILLVLCAFAGGACASRGAAKVLPPAHDIEAAHARIAAFVGEEMYGPGALGVLDVAARALAEKHATGEATLVGLEDLWAHALQEGLVLFDKPDRLWGETSAQETADMIGQATVGPWQITVRNVRESLGPRYGVDPEWNDGQVVAWCREHPEAHAKMIADYIQAGYERYGARSPYAIQRYFWLDAYVRGEIGQSAEWWRSPVAKPPAGGTWRDTTAEARRDTGFYARQVMMGTAYTKSGMLFWLVVAGDEEGARAAIRTWRDQRRVVAQGSEHVLTDEPGGFALSPADVRFADANPEIRERLKALIAEANAG